MAKKEVDAEKEAQKIAIEKETMDSMRETAEWLGNELKNRAVLNGETFMLNTAMSLTVKADGAYSRAPHTGGEDFEIIRAYFGKRDGVILVFKPVMASNYSEMELPLSKAPVLTGVELAVKETGYEQRLADIGNHKMAEREKLANAEREKAYGDDFACW